MAKDQSSWDRCRAKYRSGLGPIGGNAAGVQHARGRTDRRQDDHRDCRFAAEITVAANGQTVADGACPRYIVWSGEDAVDDTLCPASGGWRQPGLHAFHRRGASRKGKTRAFDPSATWKFIDVCGASAMFGLIISIRWRLNERRRRQPQERRDAPRPQPFADLGERTGAPSSASTTSPSTAMAANPVERVTGSLAFQPRRVSC